MAQGLFLTDRPLEPIAPPLPRNRRGQGEWTTGRVRIGIVRALKHGDRGQDGRRIYGAPSLINNHYHL